LLGKAVLNAKSRVEKTLDPLGQKIIGVKMVSISEFNIPPGPLYYGTVASSAGYKSTPVFTSNQDVTTTANVIFLIGRSIVFQFLFLEHIVSLVFEKI
jgi:uncharacterized protein